MGGAGERGIDRGRVAVLPVECDVAGAPGQMAGASGASRLYVRRGGERIELDLDGFGSVLRLIGVSATTIAIASPT